jgi:hypothetical protein
MLVVKLCSLTLTTMQPSLPTYEREQISRQYTDGSQSTAVVSKKRRNSSSQNRVVIKKLKITSGRPALAKKVSADFDSDDELIFSMKNAKYLEKDIAQRLADEGRTVYNPKTIGTRWARLKKVKQAEADKLLDADLTDWHEGDVS